MGRKIRRKPWIGGGDGIVGSVGDEKPEIRGGEGEVE